MYLNKATVIGRLTASPELRYIPSSRPVCTFAVATSFGYEKDGQRRDIVEYHNCEAWDRLAENIAEHMGKGSLVYLEGRLKTDSFDGPCGKKHYRTRIVVERCSFGPKVAKGESTPDAVPAQAGEADMEDVPF